MRAGVYFVKKDVTQIIEDVFGGTTEGEDVQEKKGHLIQQGRNSPQSIHHTKPQRTTIG